MLSTTFLMIVAPIDLGMAHYTIPAMARLVRSSAEFNAVVYCNGLSTNQVEHVADLLRRHERFSYEDNSAYLLTFRDSIRVGEWYLTDAGRREFREGNYEGCGEVWSRELVRLDADSVAMVDADFEIFEVEFAHRMVRAFSEDPHLAFFSTHSGPKRRVFEPYSQQEAFTAARCETCFCIYRRSALEEFHDFSYVEEREGGLPLKYDHSANLQEVLVRNHGYVGRSLDGHFSDQYLHYGAFAKNRSLRGRSLWFYRILRIGRHNGWIHRVRVPWLSRGIRRVANVLWRMLRMSRFDAERRRYLFDD